MISGMNHVTLSVANLDEAFTFYTEILEFKALAKRKGKSAYLLAGTDWITLVQSKEPVTESKKSYTHIAFSVGEKKFQAVADRIRNANVVIWQENSSPGESLYFLDPSGNKLEIHASNWQSRIQWLKDNPSPEVEIFV